MTGDLLRRAQAGDADAFAQLVDPYRRELQVHCYRLLGSVADAEDALQETLLSAWQGLPAFEGRASVRTWLYRVATSRCIDALRAGRRRPAPVSPPPDGLAPPEPTRLGEVLWLEPYPDDLLTGLADSTPGPEARYEFSEAISLAFITAVQLLPPRQRAAVLLRDPWPASSCTSRPAPTRPRGYYYQLLAGVGWTSLPRLRKLRPPTLILAGDDDPIIPLIMHRLIPDSQLHVYHGGHLELGLGAGRLARSWGRSSMPAPPRRGARACCYLRNFAFSASTRCWTCPAAPS